MYCKSHSVNGSIVLACCDEELLGKTLENAGNIATVSENFYGRKMVQEKEFAELLRDADSINLLGREVVGVALKEGLITERDVIRIGSVEHAIIVKLR